MFVYVNNTWQQIKTGYVYVNNQWKQFYSATAGNPLIQNSGGTQISSAYVGDTLYGYPGANIYGTYSYTWQYSLDQINWYTETGTGATGTGTNTNRSSYTTSL